MAKIDKDKLAAEQLGITLDEFKKRKALWLISLKQGNKERRKKLLNFVEEVSGLRPTQTNLRSLSRRHGLMVKEGVTYSKQVEKLFSSLPFSLPAANSPQDCYHLTHFTNAVVLCVLKPNAQPYYSEVNVLKLYNIEEDEEARVEALQLAYQTMSSWLPERVKETPKKPSLQERMNNLEKRVKKIEG